MATNPIKFREYNSGGALSKRYRIYRDANVLQIENADNNRKVEIKCETVSKAKRLMDQPATVCNF